PARRRAVKGRSGVACPEDDCTAGLRKGRAVPRQAPRGSRARGVRIVRLHRSDGEQSTPRTSLRCRSGRSLPVKKHWTVSRYADLIPLLAFALVMIGVFFVDRERAGRLEQGQADVAQPA